MKINATRANCKDVFNAFLVTLAHYAGMFEFPVIQPEYEVPNRLVSFPKALQTKDYDQWVHFYVDDYQFERIWRNPRRYLPILKRFNGVILPDFSVYQDMPLVMQLWNIFRSRAIGFWLQVNGVKVIVNVRWGDRRTYRVCCDGAPKGCTIAVGTVGLLCDADNRRHLEAGFRVIVKRLRPSTIVIYGNVPDSIFRLCREAGILIVEFECETHAALERTR